MTEQLTVYQHFELKQIWQCKNCEEEVNPEDYGRELHIIYYCGDAQLPIDFSKEITNWEPAEMSGSLGDEWALVHVDYDVEHYKELFITKQEWKDGFLAFYVKVEDGELIDIRACETDYYKLQATMRPLWDDWWKEMLGVPKDFDG